MGHSVLGLSTMTVHCLWEDETARERTGHPTSYCIVLPFINIPRISVLQKGYTGLFGSNTKNVLNTSPVTIHVNSLSVSSSRCWLDTSGMQSQRFPLYVSTWVYFGMYVHACILCVRACSLCRHMYEYVCLLSWWCYVWCVGMMLYCQYKKHLKSYIKLLGIEMFQWYQYVLSSVK